MDCFLAFRDGHYDFDIAVDAASSDPAAVKQALLDWASTLSNLEQVGLKVEARKEPADVLVIDHVEKPIPD
jgi:uncharacterized protein (TIGR03435 family)